MRLQLAGWVGRASAVAILACLVAPAESGAATRNGVIAMTTVPGGGPIWRVEPASGTSTLLTGRVGADNLAWSPDGRLLVFNETTSQKLTVGAVDSRGMRVNLRLENAYAPSFAPDGRRIAFQGCLSFCIATSRVNGTDRRELLHVDPRRCRCLVYEPRWSPQGDRVAYLRQHDRLDGTTTYAIRVRTFAGRDNAVPGEDWCRLQGDPAFSPDGRTLAFVCDDGPSSAIHVVPASGGAPRPLVAGRLPTWSPDGTQLAFVRDNADRTRSSLVVLQLRTNRQRVVLSRRGIYSIAWQPRRE